MAGGNWHRTSWLGLTTLRGFAGDGCNTALPSVHLPARGGDHRAGKPPAGSWIRARLFAGRRFDRTHGAQPGRFRRTSDEVRGVWRGDDGLSHRPRTAALAALASARADPWLGRNATGVRRWRHRDHCPPLWTATKRRFGHRDDPRL